MCLFVLTRVDTRAAPISVMALAGAPGARVQEFPGILSPGCGAAG